jgi:hypothetical protein
VLPHLPCHGTKELDDDLAARYLPSKRPARSSNAKDASKPWAGLHTTTKSLSAKRTAFFFACHPEQLAYECRLPGQKAPNRSGQFTFYFFKGLRTGAADVNHDGLISNQEAFDYASRRLDETFNRGRQGQGDRQEPVIEGDPKDSPLFGMKAALSK